jgi:sugar-specific transcriptional regulator TrmB
LSVQAVKKNLRVVGLTEKETDVYILLSRYSYLRALEVSKHLRMHKAQAYAILKSLQKKGMIEATLDKPSRFGSVPIKRVLDDFIEAKRREAVIMEREKDEILANWHSIRPLDFESPEERFAMLQGRDRIRSKLFEMIQSAKKEIQIALTPLDMVRVQNWALLEELSEGLAERPLVRLRVLTSVSRENSRIVERFARIDSSRKVKGEWRHVEIGSIDIPSTLTKDAEETCILGSPDAHGTSAGHMALWTNSRLITRLTISLFEKIWHTGTSVDHEISEVETLSPLGTSMTIADPGVAYKRLVGALREAKREIVHVIPSIEILQHERTRSLLKANQDGAAVRVMCPVGSAVGKSVRTLSKIAEMRDPNVSYLAVVLIDGQHLFRFNVPSRNASEFDPSAYFRDTFYTNDPKETKAMSQMLEGLWARSTEIPSSDPRTK